MNLLAEEDVPLEIYSVDEAFIDLTHLSDPYQYVCDFYEKIYRWIGIPVSGVHRQRHWQK